MINKTPPLYRFKSITVGKICTLKNCTRFNKRIQHLKANKRVDLTKALISRNLVVAQGSKLIKQFTSNDDYQNNPLCRLLLVVETFRK